MFKSVVVAMMTSVEKLTTPENLICTVQNVTCRTRHGYEDRQSVIANVLRYWYVIERRDMTWRKDNSTYCATLA